MPNSADPLESQNHSYQASRNVRRFEIQHDDTLEALKHTRRASQEDSEQSDASSALRKDANKSIYDAQEVSHNIARQDVAHARNKELPVQVHGEVPLLVAVDELDMPHTCHKQPQRKHLGLASQAGVTPVKTIFVDQGSTEKWLEFPTDALIAKSVVFRRLFDQDPDLDNLSLLDADPRAVVLLWHWLLGKDLGRPEDFHSLTHWFALYRLGMELEMEELLNHGETCHR